MNKIMVISYLCIFLFIDSYSVLGQDAEDNPQVNIVIEASDEARIRRSGWSEFAKLDIGAHIYIGDVIDPGSGTIGIFCSNMKEEFITQIGPLPCPQERGILYQNDQALAGWQRSDPEAVTIPYLIGPRKSGVLSSTPVIRWNPVQDVDTYRVIVRGTNLEWSAEIESVEGTTLRYPEDAPPLEPSEKYTIEVITITMGLEGSSSFSEGVPDISFQVIDDNERITIEEAVESIRETISDEMIANYVTAYFYLQQGLRYDAIELLLTITGDVTNIERELGSDISQSPAVYLTLGDAFAQIQLENLARASYANALAFADMSSSTEMQGLAALSLARILPDGNDYYTRALEEFERLGATEMIELINQEK